MAESLTSSVISRWRADPIAFVETVLHDPGTGRPFELLPAERAFLAHAFRTGDGGRLLYPEQVYSCPKKSGKTTFAAIHVLTLTLLFGAPFPEAVLAANDQEQAKGRVYEMVRRIIEASPLLKREAKITESKITFPALSATITAIASDAGGAASGNQSISCFDELWAYTSERSRRLWDEMCVPPTRKIGCRLTVTYAGFSGESLLLEELHKRGKALPLVGPDLHAGDGLLMFWSHLPVAPWQDEAWLASMRITLRPSAFSRMVLNEFAAVESQFVDLSAWDACVVPMLTPVREDRRLQVWVGVDASVKRDTTALVAVTCDRNTKMVRLVAHKTFVPTKDEPVDFALVEEVILEWYEKFQLRSLLFDPFQMAAVAQRLAREGVKMEEFPQTVPNLTAATQNLYDLIQSRSIALYPAPDLRLAISRAVMHESARGWRLDKLKQHHKIDAIVALSLASIAAVRGVGKYNYDCSMEWVSGAYIDNTEQKQAEAAAFLQSRWNDHLRRAGYRWL
jgi:phage terminase large subunit-like protein